MTLRFEQWLEDQQHREDQIGDLARDPGMLDPEQIRAKHRSDEHKSWADVVIRIAGPVRISVFNDAWQEFLLAKQAAEDALESDNPA